ncbi:diguanylate cyclase [Marinomonas ostreistagni]|uniref:diguanylate cyclase n=1 Tax=Marinomonas ostreistagni TaxID=359209 RepID=UPI0019523314|nr:diguanylate cyclase [Marinomonas ostreistagni]MBM6550801.1 GGDEF domain-containing protein [Marinomonas ostreistagni]
MMIRCFLLSLAFLLSVSVASAKPTPPTSLIESIGYFQEYTDDVIDWPQARQRFKSLQFTEASHPFLTFGISNRTTWVQVAINNPTSEVLDRRLTAGQTWIEQLNVYHLDGSGLIQEWYTGDAAPADKHLLPTKGFVFHLHVPPGRSYVLIKARTHDPLAMPIELESLEQFQSQEPKNYLASGLLYGTLLALTGFSIVLFIIFKQAYALYYAAYMSSFVVMNIGYNGYAYAWLYPNSPTFQNYSTIFIMVVHGVCGLAFMSNFLRLRERMPNLLNVIKVYAAVSLLCMSIFTLAQLHIASSIVSFGFLAITSCLMIAVGIYNAGKVPEARYFLVAVLCSMFGLFTSTVSVCGIIPYTFWGYRGAEIGVFLEAIILATIIATRLKDIESDRVTAKFLASSDPLTQLLNRRSFEMAASKLVQHAKQNHHLLSLIMLDIDHFKSINDNYGHNVGDLVLKKVAQILRNSVSEKDAIARWGGEEMVLLVSEMNHYEVRALTERLRSAIEASVLCVEEQTIQVTASFGVAHSDETQNIGQMLKLADKRLYHAKSQGRNRVTSTLTNEVTL